MKLSKRAERTLLASMPTDGNYAILYVPEPWRDGTVIKAVPIPDGITHRDGLEAWLNDQERFVDPSVA